MHATCIVWRGRERASRGQVPPANKHPSGRAAAAVGPPMCSAGQGLFCGRPLRVYYFCFSDFVVS